MAKSQNEVNEKLLELKKTDEELQLEKNKKIATFLNLGRKYFRKNDFHNAILNWENVLEIDDCSLAAWESLAFTQYSLWRYYAKNIGSLSCLMKLVENNKLRFQQIDIYLKDTYNSFLVSMEFSQCKKNPDLLLRLANLYIELQAFDGALSVCTLLVESYMNYSKINEALFLSGIAAKQLKLYEQSANYFVYLLESPPFNLRSYLLLLLAGRSFDYLPNEKEKSREAYIEAYRLMSTRRAESKSEVNARDLRKTNLSESERLNLWFMDNETWHILAESMADLDYPMLVVDAYEQALSREGCNTPKMLVSLGLSYFRIKEQDKAFNCLELALQLDSFYLPARYIIGSWNSDWQAVFDHDLFNIIEIQRVLRGYFGRKRANARRLEIWIILQNTSAETIQRSIRCYFARKRLEELRVLEREREVRANIDMSKEDMLLIMKVLNANAVIIQGLHIIFTAKKKVMILRDKLQRQQELIKVALGNHDNRSMGLCLHRMKLLVIYNKEEKHNAAVLIQLNTRMYLAKKRYAKLIFDTKKREELIRMCLGRRMDQILKDSFKLLNKHRINRLSNKNKAASKIQNLIRSYHARKIYTNMLHKHERSVEMVRRMLLKREQHTCYLCLQALHSHMKSMKILYRKKAIVLQRNVRGFIGRKKAIRVRRRQKKCEKYVQICRKKANERMKEFVVESLLMHIQFQDLERNYSATLIQKRIRGVFGRKSASKRKMYQIIYGGKGDKSMHTINGISRNI